VFGAEDAVLCPSVGFRVGEADFVFEALWEIGAVVVVVGVVGGSGAVG